MNQVNEFQFDVKRDNFIPLSEAGKLFPQVGGKHPHRSNLYRWAVSGIAGHRLPTVRVGRRIVTTEAAVGVFIETTAASLESQAHTVDAVQ